MGETDRFQQIGIDGDGGILRAEPDGDRFRDAGDFHRVGEAGAIEIVFAGLEDLSLGLEPAEGRSEHDAIAVLMEDAAVIGLSGIVGGIAEVIPIVIAVERVRHDARVVREKRQGNLISAGREEKKKRRGGGF
jgi:hypothetical protein